jgi:hypothetical protein
MDSYFLVILFALRAFLRGQCDLGDPQLRSDLSLLNQREGRFA